TIRAGPFPKHELPRAPFQIRHDGDGGPRPIFKLLAPISQRFGGGLEADPMPDPSLGPTAEAVAIRRRRQATVEGGDNHTKGCPVPRLHTDQVGRWRGSRPPQLAPKRPYFPRTWL